MFVLAMFLGGFCLPLSIIIVCYALIFWTVQKHEHMLRMHGSANSNFHFTNRNYKSEVKVARVSAVVVLVFCLAWLPYAVVGLIGVAGQGHTVTPIASLIPALFAKVSVVYNPLVYALSMKRFQQRVRSCFNCTCVEEHSRYATETLVYPSSSNSSRKRGSPSKTEITVYAAYDNSKKRNSRTSIFISTGDELAVGTKV
jgi:r-opsin